MLRDPLPNEEVLTLWHTLTLTTIRVVQSAKYSDNETISTSLLLSHISGTSVERLESRGYLGAAGAAVIAAVVTAQLVGHFEILWIGVALAAVFVWAFFESRGVILTVYADGRHVRSTRKGTEANVREARRFADRAERLAVLAQRGLVPGLSADHLSPQPSS